MRLPRWLMISMLTASAFTVLTAAGWSWVTWPERTAREFVRLLSEENFEDAWRMISTEEPHPRFKNEILAWIDRPTDPDYWTLYFAPRSIPDVMFGRQMFRVGQNGGTWVVERGSFCMAIGTGADFVPKSNVRFPHKPLSS